MDKIGLLKHFGFLKVLLIKYEKQTKQAKPVKLSCNRLVNTPRKQTLNFVLVPFNDSESTNNFCP